MKTNVLIVILFILSLSGYSQDYYVYKGNSSSTFDIKYTLESRASGGYKVYKGKSTFTSDFRFTVEKKT